jgi:hypothetical protein
MMDIVDENERQHDDHCWLTVGGAAWKIKQITNQKILLWQGLYPFVTEMIVDMRSNFNYEAYCKVAHQILMSYYDYENIREKP